MVPSVVFLLLGLMLTGVFFALVGLRGRKINDHPICRGCHFDLHGVYPEGVTCPECGAGLKRERAVRIGARRKNIPLALLGLFLLAAPTVPMGVVGYAVLTGTDVNKYKPLGLLLWESGHATPAQSDRIAAELMSRALAGSLAPDQYTRVIEHTLAMQADTSRPWSEAWGDLIERAKLDSVLTKAQEDRFNANMLPLEFTFRKSARAGSTIPVLIKAKEFRGSSGSSVTSELLLKGVKVGGKPARPVPRLQSTNPFDREDPSTIATLSAGGSRSSGWFSTGGGNEGGFSLTLPDDLPPGEHPIELDLAQRVDSANTGRAIFIVNGRASRMQGGSGAEHPVALSSTLQIVNPAEASQPIAPDDATTQAIKKGLTPSRIEHGLGSLNQFASGQLLDPTATIDFGEADLPAPIAYDVFIRDGNQEHKVGTLTTGKSAPKPANTIQSLFSSSFTMTINGRTTTRSSSSSPESARRVSGPCPAPEHDVVDVILRPSAAAAESTLDQTRYYGGEIIYQDVPVTKDPFRQMGEDPFRQLMPQMFQRVRPVTPRKLPG